MKIAKASIIIFLLIISTFSIFQLNPSTLGKTEKGPQIIGDLNGPSRVETQDNAIPVIYEWNRTWRGILKTYGQNLAIDNDGNVYLVGYTSNFSDTTADAFLLKYDPLGNLLWNQTWGGNNSDFAYGVAVDANNDVYITGWTWSFGSGNSDAFVVKYNPSGIQIWNRTWGTPNWEYGQGIAIDNLNLYIAGRSSNLVDFNWFLVRLDTEGNQIWNRTFQDGQWTSVNDIAAEGNSIYITGENSSISDILLIKFDASGVQQWTRSWSSPEYEEGNSVVIDGNYVYVTGITGYNNSYYDTILIKYDSAGNKIWERIWGGSEFDDAYGVAVDDKHNIYMAGCTDSFDVGFTDVFLVKYNANGDRVWNITWGEYTPREQCFAIAIYGNDTIYLGGYNYSSGGVNERDALLIKVITYHPSTPILEAISPNPNHHGFINIDWHDISSARSYYVFRDTSNITSVSGLTPISKIPITSWQDRITINGTYYYALIAENSEGNSSISNSQRVVVEIYPMNTAPILFSITPNPDHDRIVNLAWTPINGASHYYIFRDESSIVSLTGLTPIATSTNSYYFDVITENNTYYYAIVAGNVLFNSSISNSEMVEVITFLPFKEWESEWGTGDDDSGTSIAVDNNHSIYIAGDTNSYGTSYDILVMKYNSTGSQIWNRTWGNVNDDHAYSITIDQNNSIYVTGTIRQPGKMDCDMIILKYNSTGTLLWSKVWGGLKDDIGYDIEIDNNFNVYIAGITIIERANITFFWRNDTFSPLPTDISDALLVKFDSMGNYLWNRTHIFSSYINKECLKIDKFGDIYFAGVWNKSIFVSKLNNSGNLIWNYNLSGSGVSITLDEPNLVFLTRYNGSTVWVDFINAGLTPLWNLTYNQTFLEKVTRASVINISIFVFRTISNMIPSPTFLDRFDFAGNLLWTKLDFYDSVTGPDIYQSLTCDLNNIYLLGSTNDWVFWAPLYGQDIKLMKLNSTGHSQWNVTIGKAGCNNDYFYDLLVDNNKDIYCTGYTDSFGSGLKDVLLVKYTSLGEELWNRTWGDSKDDRGSAITMDSDQNIYITGTRYRPGFFSSDVFLLKYDPLGNLLWNKTWNSATNVEGYDLAYYNNSIYLVGATGGGVLLLKYDSEGNFLWNHIWNTSGYDVGYAVAVEGNSIYITGESNESAILIKYDSTGSQMWNRTWTSIGGETCYGIAVKNDSIYIGGDASPGNFAFLLKYNSSGNLLWGKTWVSDELSIPYNIPHVSDLTVDLQENIYLVSSDALVKLDPFGNELWTTEQNVSDSIIIIYTNSIRAISVDNEDNIYFVRTLLKNAVLDKYTQAITYPFVSLVRLNTSVPEYNEDINITCKVFTEPGVNVESVTIWYKIGNNDYLQRNMTLILDNNNSSIWGVILHSEEFSYSDQQIRFHIEVQGTNGIGSASNSQTLFIGDSTAPELIYLNASSDIIFVNSPIRFYAGIEEALDASGMKSAIVYYSYDSGLNWTSLNLNLDNASYTGEIPFIRSASILYYCLRIMDNAGNFQWSNTTTTLEDYPRIRVIYPIVVEKLTFSDSIWQDELLLIELNISRNSAIPLNITIHISGENFQEYWRSFVLSGNSTILFIELRYYPIDFLDQGQRDLQIEILFNDLIMQSFNISTQIKLPFFISILIPFFLIIGALAVAGVTYQIRKVRKEKNLVFTYLKAAKNNEIPISILAIMTELEPRKIERILNSLILKNQIIGSLKKHTFYRATKKEMPSSMKEGKTFSKDFEASIKDKIDLTNISLDNTEFLFNMGNITPETYKLIKSELLSERRKLKMQIEILDRFITIVSPEIYNEIEQLSVSDEQKMLILTEISSVPTEEAQSILKEYKRLLGTD